MLPFREIWAVDFEFVASGGERTDPVCLVAWELKSGRRIRLWCDEFGDAPPYAVDPDALFVSFHASAEIGCHLALGWPKPARILDLRAEFRNFTNGLPESAAPAGKGLIGALTYFGLDSIGAAEKDAMRDLILRGGPWSEQEREAILDYCEGDVDALARLLPVMLARRVWPEHVDLGRALFRGRFMAAAAAMEHFGVPVDVPLLNTLRERWTGIQDQLIAEIDKDYGVYDGRVFKKALFAALLAKNGIPWPRLESGELNLDKDVWRQAAKSYPFIAPLYELRASLSELRLKELAVGSDGRNRCVLWPFGAKTSRNQPSTSQFIFGPATWFRGLIKPPPGYGLAYIDWEQQEFAIAAVLSGDQAMMAAYETGNPYLALAKRVNAVPADATKQTHPDKHHQFKQVSLGRLYGQGPMGLAVAIGQSTLVASELIRYHQGTFHVFRQWSDEVVDKAVIKGGMRTVFGWQMHVVDGFNPRSLRNFPMQANAAEMLRLACCLGTEAGLEICAPIHDAVLIMASLERLDDDVAAMRAAMGEASRVVLAGYELKTDVKVVRNPNRYMDPRGEVMWRKVMQLIGDRGDKGMGG